MTQKPTYEELENRVKELELIAFGTKQFDEGLLSILSEAERLTNFGSWEWDIVRDKWTMSDNWLKIHGYTGKVLTTEELLTIAYPDDINRIQEAFNQCINNGKPYEIEHRIVRHETKEVRYIRAHGRVESDSTGKPVKLYGAAQDITEYKRQEVELKQSEEQYRNLVEETPDLIVRVGTEGRIVFVNHAAQNVYGLSPQECLGRSAFDFIHPEDRDATVASFNDWLRCPDNVLTYENRIVNIDGQRKYHMAWMILPERDESGSIIGFSGTARDITDQKWSEKALTKSNKDLQLAQRIANVGNWSLDPDVGVPEWSDEIYRILERNPVAGPYSLAEYKNLFKGEWFEQFNSAIQRAIHEGQPYDHELKIEFAPDHVKWVRAICEPERKAGSKKYFLRGTIQDITERKRAEEMLWKEKAFLRSLIDSAEDLIYFKDQNSIYRSCNKASEKFTGLLEVEQVGKSDFDFFDQEFAEQVVNQDQAVLVGGTPVRVEEWVERPNSDRKLLETVKAPIYGADGQAIGLVGISRDITERYRMEKNLRESEERFKEMFDKHSAMMLLIEPESGAIIDANRAAENFYRYSRVEILAMNINQINTLQPEDINEQRLKAATEDNNFFIFPHKISSGEIRTVEVHSTPIKINDKVLLFSIIHDITDRKRAEEEKLELQQQLQQAQKLESLGVLAGGIAHDFNNILAGLFGNLSLAKTKLAKDHPDHPGFRYLDAAENAMSRATLLSGQLLTFAKGGEPVTENLSLGNLIEEAVLFNLSGSNVKPVISMAENLWYAKADQGQIQQVFGNLTINAKHAMPDGGHLHITLKNIHVAKNSVADIDEGKYLLITVTDEGIGITPENLERIFDPYFTTKQAGTGLGLATVFSIIKRHGGHVSATSQVGKGTTFTLYLPASEEKKQVTDNTVPTPGTFKQAAKVLVMDDDGAIRSTATAMLEECSHAVQTVEDGQGAVERYQLALTAEEPFDLVILDLTIPGAMGGKETAKKLLEIDPGVRMVVSSGYADDPVMANYAEYGFIDVLTKPYNIKKLTTVVARVLGS